MTKNPEEDNTTEEQTEATPTRAEEPVNTEPEAEAPPTGSEDPPTSTEDQTNATPPAAEAPPSEAQSNEVEPPAKKTDDFFDMDPGKADTSAEGASQEVTESSAPQEATPEPTSESKGHNATEDEGLDEPDTVPVLEGEEEVPVQETGATSTAEPASGEDTTTTTAAEGDDTPAVNGTEEASQPAETSQPVEATAEDAAKDNPATDSPAEPQEVSAETPDAPTQAPDSSAETKDTPCEVQVTVTEAEEVAADGGQEEGGVAAEASAENGGEETKGEDVTDTPTPVSSPVVEKSEVLPVGAPETRPSTAAYDYDDDFHSLLSTEGVTSAAEPEKAATEEAPAQPIVCPSPTVSEEVRAEAGFVVPVPASVPQSDGRSQVEERGEYRGEDRSELQGDGGENARGQGQWKTEEETMVQSTLAEQLVGKEAMQKITEEKEKLEKELDDLKGRYVSLEEGSRQWELEAGSLKEKCQVLESRIKELEAEVEQLKEQAEANKQNEAKVKDLQERLATLSDEDAKKEQRIQKLQGDLQESESRLTAAEHQATASREAAERMQQQPNQPSKTCSIM